MSQGEARLQQIGGAALASTIYKIGLVANASGNLNDVLAEIVRHLLDETGACWVSIGMINQNRTKIINRWSLHTDGWQPSREISLPIGKGIVGKVAETGKPICINSTKDNPLFFEVVPGTQSEIAVPLVIGETIIGVLNIESRSKNFFGQAVMTLLQALSTPISLTIRNAQLFDEQRRHTEQLTLLNQVSQIITSTVDLDCLLSRTVESVCTLLDYEMVAIGLVEGDEVVLKAAHARDHMDIPVGFRQPIGIGVTGEVVKSGESILVPDISEKENYTTAVQNVCCEMCCPLRVGDEIIGFLDAESCVPNAFNNHDLLALQTIADHISQAVENARNLDRINEIREDLVVMVVHDLRNPLTVIQSALDLLSLHVDMASTRDGADIELCRDLKKYCANSQCASQEMFVLINGLLDLQKMEAGAIELSKYACHAGDLMRSVAHKLQIVAEVRKVKLEVHSEENLPLLECDVQLMSRVFENLASNALKFVPENGVVSLEVKTALSEILSSKLPEVPRALIFTVDDTGPGIPREEWDRVFEKFAIVESRKNKSKKSSTGLGLAFCNHAVKAHGGVIWVEGEEDQSSKFCILLPLLSEDDPIHLP